MKIQAIFNETSLLTILEEIVIIAQVHCTGYESIVRFLHVEV
jgi:hypothetical protein